MVTFLSTFSIYFNPRAPCGARRISTFAFLRLLKFQSTRPMRGATRRAISGILLKIDFNPRAPCGARQESIFGRDSGSGFQSTRPMRGATDTVYGQTCPLKFQSTRPMRGATWCMPDGLLVVIKISIHAPHAGRDMLPSLLTSWPTNFNPRAPCGARPLSSRISTLLIGISIHAPHAGRDHPQANTEYQQK